MPAEHRVRVHFFEARTPVRNLFSRHDFQAVRQRHGVLPAVRLEVTDDDIDPAALELLRFDEHLIGLAHARGIAQKHLQASTRGPRRGYVHCGNTRTSIPSASRISWSSG